MSFPSTSRKHGHAPAGTWLARHPSATATQVEKGLADVGVVKERKHALLGERGGARRLSAGHYIREDAQRAKYRLFGPGAFLTVGDYVMVRKAPVQGVSTRFQYKHHDGVFQVVEVHGENADAKAYLLSDLAGLLQV